MIAEDMLTQAQQRCIPDVSFELIPIRNLVSNQEYQRPLSENHIRKALEEFDVYHQPGQGEPPRRHQLCV
mgnify:CR=1 FL=1